MPYCPKCEVEYLDGVTTCNDCQATLVTEQPPTGDRSDLVEFYRTTDRLEANLIRDYLTDRGVECVVFDTAPYPFNTSDRFERRVFVTSGTKDRAQTALDEAREAGMLSQAGHFVVE